MQYGMPPIMYEPKNAFTSLSSPSTIHVKNTNLSRYFAKYLMQKAISVFKWDMPEEWSREYFLYSLYSFGYIAIVNTQKFGVIPQHCGLSGYDIFYRPSHVLVTNPLLHDTLNLRISKQCVLLKLMPDYTGITDMVNYYANLLALASESLAGNILNSKLAKVFFADNKTLAESLKKMYDTVAGGDPAVFVDNAAGKNKLDGKKSWECFADNLSQNYIAESILKDMNTIEHDFDSNVGIPNSDTGKRERMIVDEVNSNNIETVAKAELWLESLKRGCEEVKTMFEVDISVDWRFDYEPSSNTIVDGSVAVR